MKGAESRPANPPQKWMGKASIGSSTVNIFQDNAELLINVLKTTLSRITFNLLEKTATEDEGDATKDAGDQCGPRGERIATGANGSHAGHRSVHHGEIAPIVAPEGQQAVNEQSRKGAATAAQQRVERCVRHDRSVARPAD